MHTISVYILYRYNSYIADDESLVVSFVDVSYIVKRYLKLPKTQKN